MLRQAGLAEQAGSGLPLIRRTWDETGRPAPELRNDGGRKRFEVTFHWGEEQSHEVNEAVRKHGDRVNGPVEGVKRATDGANDGANDGASGGVGADTLLERLLALITTEPGLRVPALHRRLGVSTATVERALRKLKTDRLIDFRGATKSGGYYASANDKDADS